MLFFSSDHHFSHHNIIRYCGRPFASLEEMDEAIIARHNAVVGPRDIVYFLGDFCFRTSDPSRFVKRLNGQLHLLRGNHDRLQDAGWLEAGFKGVYGDHKNPAVVQVRVDGVRLVLCHYAMLTWPGKRDVGGSIHLFGHSHGTLAHSHDRAFDVGVDKHDFTPWSLEQVLEEVKRREARTAIER